VFAPALHALSHAHGRPADRIGGSIAGRTAARTGASVPAADRTRPVRTGAELLPAAGGDDRALCDELPRTPGDTAAGDRPLAAAEGIRIAPRAEQGTIRTALTDTRPPARAPPRVPDC